MKGISMMGYSPTTPLYVFFFSIVAISVAKSFLLLTAPAVSQANKNLYSRSLR
jgi:hypothetical protein